MPQSSMIQSQRVRRQEGRTLRGFTPFRFRDLAPELRNRIYEYMVRPSAFNKPEAKYLTRLQAKAKAEEEKEKEQKCACDLMLQVSHQGCVNATEPAFIASHILPGPSSLFYVKCADVHGDAIIDYIPDVLSANRQIRSEALALFYTENTFVFDEDCEEFLAKEWLFEVVGWANIDHVRRIYQEFDDESTPSHTDVVDYAVLILLMELRLLKCQLRVTWRLFSNEHIGCKLREDVRDLIAAQGIVKGDVEGKPVRVLEGLVAGTAMHWLDHWLNDEGGVQYVCGFCDDNEDGETPVAPVLESPAGDAE